MSFAVIETGGKQYLVEPGIKLRVEKLGEPSKSGEVTLDKVLLSGDGSAVKIGSPYVSGARVSAKLLSEGKGKKIPILRYHSKTRYRKKKGHRQFYSEILIKEIKI